jgi:uncharacterized protein YegP (UPF0339 family)
MGKFICSKRTNGEYQFNLNAANGQTILTSEGYSAKSGCANGIESVKSNASDDSKYERKTASNGKAYFVLKAGNGQVIGTSQMYADESGCEKGIESVKTNASDATIEDNTN